MAEERLTGVVRWFSDSKGYGFIKPDDGEEELFVHHSSIKSDGYRTLTEGATVEFTFAFGEDDKPKAVDVTGPDGAPVSPPPPGPRRFTGGGGGGSGGWRRDNHASDNGSGCYNCGELGHLARDCPNSSMGGGPSGGGGGGGSCYSCGMPGHFARECRGRGGGGGGGGGACYSCGGFGHMARDCRGSGGGSFGGRFGGRTGGGSGGGGCYTCGEQGHFARECTNKA